MIKFGKISTPILENHYHFTIYNSVQHLPTEWNTLAEKNVFLSSQYLEVLEKSAPNNMCCFFVALYKQEKLVGILLSQFLDLNQLESFGDRDQCIKKRLRNFIFKNFASQVLFIGNNMLTGQNAYSFSVDIEIIEGLKQFPLIIDALKKNLKKLGKKVHITTIKDFDASEIKYFDNSYFSNYYLFSTQPNMVFTINENWHSNDDYLNALSKKYRDQYKRARKKANQLVKRKIHLEEIVRYENEIHNLYYYVAKNAPFNTFFLRENHFRLFKEKLKDKFLFYGYFLDDKLVGFNTLIKNGTTMDTYFLGYDATIQRDKMLYLNMLYDMIGYSINKGFKEIVFARTALEIKSSVGAKPVKMYGYIQHSNRFINKYMSKIFPLLEPETLWQERNPFK